MSSAGSRGDAVRVVDAARLLGISSRTAYNLVYQGVIPSIRAERGILVPRAGLTALLSTCLSPQSRRSNESDDLANVEQDASEVESKGKYKEAG